MYFFVLCFRLILHPHNGSYQNSSLVKFQGPVQQISQYYQSLPAHLTPNPQDTPKPVQEQQQQEQLKNKTTQRDLVLDFVASAGTAYRGWSEGHCWCLEI
jgi:hypothetical protein